MRLFKKKEKSNDLKRTNVGGDVGAAEVKYKKYGYARVSTSSQYKNGNSIEEQEEKLIASGCDEVIKEAFTGTKTDRPELKKLWQRLNEGDTFVVTKLDRFARTAIDGVKTVQELMERGVKVHILNMGLVEDTPMGRLILTTMLAFAEFERDMIIERTQAGKELARRNPDYKEGRPKIYSKKQIEHALELLESHTYREVEELTGMSKSTLIRAKRKNNNI